MNFHFYSIGFKVLKIFEFISWQSTASKRNANVTVSPVHVRLKRAGDPYPALPKWLTV